ncbi:MAG: FtsW/RodA/SpoVE family cell cycle protein [Chloroflexota bacterium]
MASIAQAMGSRVRVRQSANPDPYLYVIVAVLTLFGLVAIWSASGGGPITLGAPVTRQFIYAVFGAIAMIAISNVNYRFLKSFAIPIYLISVGLLLALPVIGTTITGSTRWIYIGPLSFQPSEIAKLAVVIALAGFLSERHDQMDRIHNFIIAGLIVFIPFALVYIQPDLGTAGAFVVIWLTMMIVSKTRLLYLVGLFLISIPISLFAWEFLLQDYQRDRLLVSFDPYRDYFGAGFNIIQAQVTIGTSGWFGHGLSGGLQSEYEFLRVQETDFIFAHAMSMFGFVGGLALFVVLLMMFHRMTRAIGMARDTFGQYVATGITAVMVFQTFVNIGMNLGLMPVTGIPLPFVSLGGTALFTNLVAIGILQSVLIHRRVLAFQPQSPGLRRI